MLLFENENFEPLFVENLPFGKKNHQSVLSLKKKKKILF